MGKTFVEMEEMYRGIVNRFHKIELQDWKARGPLFNIERCVR